MTVKTAGSISLTTTELATALSLCGYEHLASQVINSMNLIDDHEVDRFIQQTELSLRNKGLIDEKSKTLLVSGLEDLLHLLVHSKKKVRCVRKNEVLFIHSIDESTSLIQEISNQTHTFTIKTNKDGFTSHLFKHFKMEQTTVGIPEDSKAMLLSDELYDQLHQIDPSLLDELIQNDQVDLQLKLFLKDLKSNNQEFDNISLMTMDYIKDIMEIGHVIFLLPSKEYLWYVDYEKVGEQEIYIIPIETTEYFNKLEELFIQFFQLDTDLHGATSLVKTIKPSI